MEIDPNILMQGKAVDTATPIRQQQADVNNNALAAEQTLKAHYDNMGERDKQRLQSTVVGASQLKAYLDKNDVEGAHEFLVQRQNALHQRMGAGENVDDQETAYALDKIRRGDIDGLKNDVGAMIAAGQAYGMIGGQDGTPSSVKEWQYYNSLSPQDQNRWKDQKRAGSNLNLGGTQVHLDASGNPVASYDVTLKPEDQPANAEKKADATARGNVSGTNAGNAAFSAEGLKGVKTALQDLQTSGKTAPGGVAQNLGAQIANQSGMGGTSADAQGTFTVKRAAAENAIREAFRVAGSGASSDADALPFINMLPVENDADSVKIAKTNAAMEAVQNRINVKLKQAQGAGASAPGGQGTQPGKMIKITNGQESYEIEPTDWPAAEQQGFKQVQ